MATTEYFFVFGRTPQLAFLELSTLFPQAIRIVDDVAMVKFDHPMNAFSLITLLGGTTKIAQKVGEVSVLDGQLSGFLSFESESLTFGVSLFGDSTLPKTLLSDMKKIVEEGGYPARYITSREGKALSSVVVDKEHAQELVVIRINDQFAVGKTAAVQPYDAWSIRDYDRPHADAKSGMLPPKVARMLVNIAIGHMSQIGQMRQKTMLDPFCGMGTILAEGYMTGSRVIGCDTSERVVQKARENLSWLVSNNPDTKGAVAKIFVSDAVHVSDVLSPASVHAIVTEPFMGSTDIVNKKVVELSRVRNIIKGLEKLYIGCLRDWIHVLVPKGKIIIALPAYAISGRTYFVKKVVDMCENLGYTIVDGPIEYSRPQAVVKRNFYVFRKLG